MLLVLPDSRKMQVSDIGARDGEAIIFLPGCPDSRLVAHTGAAAAAAAGVRLISINRPGYGASDPHPSTHLTVADDIANVADALDVQQFALLGMSLGGPYALACAGRHPNRVRAVGVVASPARPTDLAELSLQDAMARLRPEYAAWVARIGPTDPDDQALVNRWLTAVGDDDRRVQSRWDVDTLAASVREALADPSGYLRDAALTFRHWDFDLRGVTCPVSLWYGANDTNVSRDDAEWLAANLGDATLNFLPDTTHLQSLVDNWSVFFRAL